MTELNLKSVNFKKMMAAFLVVCLVILSIPTDVFAELADFQMGGSAADTVLRFKVVTQLSAEEIKKCNANGNIDDEYAEELAHYTGNLKVEAKGFVYSELDDFKESEKINYKTSVSTIRVVEGSISDNIIEVTIPANKDTIDKFITLSGSLLTEDGNIAVYRFSEAICQSAQAVQEPSTSENEILESKDEKETDDAKNALESSYYSNDVENIITEDRGKSKIIKKDVVTVTVYDGIPKNAKNPQGTIIGVFQKEAGATVSYTSKMSQNKHNKYSNNNQMMECEGYYLASKIEMNKATKKYEIDWYQQDGKLVEFAASDSKMPQTDMIAVAKWVPMEFNKVAGIYKANNINTNITIGAGQTRTTQIIKEGVSANYATISYNEVIDRTLSEAEQNITKDSKAIKNVISKISYNPKTNVLTVKAGKHEGSAKLSIYLANSMNDKQGKKLGDIKITVTKDSVTAYEDGILLMTMYGADEAVLDKNTANNSIPLLAAPGTDGLKYFVSTRSDLRTSEGHFNTKKERDQAYATALKEIVKKSPAKNATVKNGIVKAVKVTDNPVYVYAYYAEKSGNNDYRIEVSNPVRINIKGTTTEFTLKGGARLKYNNFTTIKDEQNKKVKKYTGYKNPLKNKKETDKQISFTIKTKGETTDTIAVRAINMDGKVILGGIKKGKKAGSYYINIKGDREYTSEDDVIVIATAPSGVQHWVRLSFVPR